MCKFFYTEIEKSITFEQLIIKLLSSNYDLYVNYRIGLCSKILTRTVFKNKDVPACCTGYTETADGRCAQGKPTLLLAS